MVLLRGLNYDYSGQQSSEIIEGSEAGKLKLTLANTEGFAENDYILINPGKEQAEIVQVNEAVSSNTQITVSALKFNHLKKEKVYRLPYNQMKFYECSTLDGTYTAVVAATTEMQYTENYTTYEYTGSTSDYYYKRTFYNAVTTEESDMALSEAWQTDEEDLYVTPDEMRMFLQFDKNDFPSQSDIRFFLKIAMINVGLDMNTSVANVLFIGTLLQAKALIIRSLATKAVSKGYIQVNAEGRTITKAYQELVLEAENTTQEYKEFLLRNGGRREATATNFMDDTTMVDDWTRKDIINMMNGTTNAEEFQTYYGYKRY